MSRVNFAVQETASPEPKCSSTWLLPQPRSSKCVAERGRIQRYDLCPQGGYSPPPGAATRLTKLSEHLSYLDSDHSIVLTAFQPRSPPASRVPVCPAQGLGPSQQEAPGSAPHFLLVVPGDSPVTLSSPVLLYFSPQHVAPTDTCTFTCSLSVHAPGT